MRNRFLWWISLCRKCNQRFRYYWGNLNERFAYVITSRECSRCIHWWYNCGFYNKCIFHYIRIYQSTLFATRVPRVCTLCNQLKSGGKFRDVSIVRIITRTLCYNNPCILWNKLTNEMKLYLNIRNMMFIIIYLFFWRGRIGNVLFWWGRGV